MKKLSELKMREVIGGEKVRCPVCREWFPNTKAYRKQFVFHGYRCSGW